MFWWSEFPYNAKLASLPVAIKLCAFTIPLALILPPSPATFDAVIFPITRVFWFRVTRVSESLIATVLLGFKSILLRALIIILLPLPWPVAALLVDCHSGNVILPLELIAPEAVI